MLSGSAPQAQPCAAEGEVLLVTSAASDAKKKDLNFGSACRAGAAQAAAQALLQVRAPVLHWAAPLFMQLAASHAKLTCGSATGAAEAELPASMALPRKRARVSAAPTAEQAAAARQGDDLQATTPLVNGLERPPFV